MAQQRMTEREFFRNPSEWPCWPVLPMKMRHGEFNDPKFCGLVHVSSPTRLYYVNMLSLGARKPKTWSEALEGIEYKDYPSDAALLTEYMID